MGVSLSLSLLTEDLEKNLTEDVKRKLRTCQKVFTFYPNIRKSDGQ